MKPRTWAVSLLLFGAVGLLPALPASAQNLPSSVDVMTGKWRVMNPTTYDVKHDSVLSQFDRLVPHDNRLTPQKRARLADMLKKGEGTVAAVPDGINLDFLTGRRQGSPFVWTDMEKALGRSDRALMFDLGDGVIIYWFTGDPGKSCNNIGVVFVPKKDTPPPKIKIVCAMVPEEESKVFRSQGYIPAVYISSCCTGGVCGSAFIGGLRKHVDRNEQDAARVRVCLPQKED